MLTLSIANTISDLIQGDVSEHLPLERIPLEGDVLGLGTTTSLDNGELTFLHQDGEPRTRLYKCQALDGGIRLLQPGDGGSHFPYVCFSGDASAARHVVDPTGFGPAKGVPLQRLVGEAITAEIAGGRMEPAPIVGVRLRATWSSLVITVASKLCMGQRRRNAAAGDLAAAADPTATEAAAASLNLYATLQHYRLAEQDPGDPADPIRYLGSSLEWDCCGFWDTRPESGRVTVPMEGAHLHLHGCSSDLRHGGHLHHEHPGTRLLRLDSLALYPLRELRSLGSDLAVESPHYSDGLLSFSIANQGTLDVSDVGVAVVIDDRYSDHRYLRIPWLAAGARQAFTLNLELAAGPHELLVVVDPERQVLEPPAQQGNNRVLLRLEG